MNIAIKESARQYVKGFVDSIHGVVLVYHLDHKIVEKTKDKEQRQNERIQMRSSRFGRRSTQTTQNKFNDTPRLLNRVFLSATMSSFIWISIWLFNQLVLPFVLHYVHVFTNRNNITRFEHTETSLQLVFSSLWVMPLFLLSKIVNGIWFIDIANSVYEFYHGKPRSFPTIGKMIADLIYGIVVETVFLLQANLIKLLPFLDSLTYVLFILHHSLLYAMYAFEYKWFNMGLDIKLRIRMIEEHWPYFWGFGTPLFILTNLTYSYYPTVISACVFSITFPFFIISATRAGTPRETPAIRLRLFELSTSISNTLFRGFVRPRQDVSSQN